MNAPVLALIGADPAKRDPAAISAICMKSATRPASSSGWSIIRRRIRAPGRRAAPGRRGRPVRCSPAGPGPAALECAMDVWGRVEPVRDDGAARRCSSRRSTTTRSQAAAKLLGAAKNPMIVCGGGAQDASEGSDAAVRHAAGAGARLSARPRRARQPRSAQRSRCRSATKCGARPMW